jgi:hypothetical protein
MNLIPFELFRFTLIGSCFRLRQGYDVALPKGFACGLAAPLL